MAASSGLSAVVKESLDRHLGGIEKEMKRDAIAVYGPILGGMDTVFREAIEALEPRGEKPSAVVILDTLGGSAEVVERMVETIRTFYDDVAFIIPDRAMSAGTIFAMSGDAIYMDYFSRLGPIDPQVVKDDRLVPALSYLDQYERLIEKDRQGTLTNAEYALLSKFDLAELHQFEQARELSITLLKKWLASYKFKTWTATERSRKPVDQSMREARAEQIAKVLNDNKRWHSHGRGISRATLQGDDIKLKIDDLAANRTLQECVKKYHSCLSDYIQTLKVLGFVHSRAYF